VLKQTSELDQHSERLNPDGSVDCFFRVRYAETDAMGVVHHASYIVWFEEGRSSFMRAHSYPYSQVERDGFYFTVTEVHARLVASARYDEQVAVRTRVGELRSRGIRFDYEVRRATDGALLVTGYTRHVCIDHQGRVRTIPDELRQLMRTPSKKSIRPLPG